MAGQSVFLLVEGLVDLEADVGACVLELHCLVDAVHQQRMHLEPQVAHARVLESLVETAQRLANLNSRLDRRLVPLRQTRFLSVCEVEAAPR